MDAIQWLLSADPWVVYRTRLDILSEDQGAPAVQGAYAEMIAHPKIQSLLTDLSEWSGPALKSHKKAGHLLHKLVFIADLGLHMDHPQVAEIMTKVLSKTSEEGPFQIIVNLPKHFGGSGEDELSWMLCDAGSTLYAAAKIAGCDHPMVLRAADYIAGLVDTEFGWPCAATKALGRFRGPGKKGDPCPYANLLMVKALLPFGERYRDQIQLGVNALLSLWEVRKTNKPYLFAMGSGFIKLKAPLVWYDLMHVLDVLTQIPSARNEPALLEMRQILEHKADPEGRFKPESIWMDWRGWDFGQKREPSQWLTLLATRILLRFSTDHQ